MLLVRGRSEVVFWSSEEACNVRLEDRAAVMDRLVYAATNPVKDYSSNPCITVQGGAVSRGWCPEGGQER